MNGPVCLLDVNLLLALAWPNHQFHPAAHTWFAANGSSGWATCAVTELGFVRLSSNPAYTAAAVSPAQAASLLASISGRPGHQFLDCPPLVKLTNLAHAMGHKQVTDSYLVSLAAAAGCKLATFDARLRALDKQSIVVVVPP